MLKVLLILFFFIYSLNLFAGDGRFQFIVNPQFRSESILIDTQTGNMWQRTCIANNNKATNELEKCAMSAWIKVDIEGISVDSKKMWKQAADIEAKLSN